MKIFLCVGTAALFVLAGLSSSAAQSGSIVEGVQTGNEGARTAPYEGSRVLPYEGSRMLPYEGSRVLPYEGSRVLPYEGMPVSPLFAMPLQPYGTSATAPMVYTYPGYPPGVVLVPMRYSYPHPAPMQPAWIAGPGSAAAPHDMLAPTWPPVSASQPAPVEGPKFTNVGPKFTNVGPKFTNVGPKFTNVGPKFTNVGAPGAAPALMHQPYYGPVGSVLVPIAWMALPMTAPAYSPTQPPAPPSQPGNGAEPPSPVVCMLDATSGDKKIGVIAQTPESCTAIGGAVETEAAVAGN